MPPRTQMLRQFQVCLRQRAVVMPARPAVNILQGRRYITADEKPLPTKDTPGKGPNQDQLQHVSEEAAAMGKITGEGGPDLDQGTPVQEVLQRDPKAKETTPQVLRDDGKTQSPKGTRSYSTTARRQQELALQPQESTELDATGTKFGLPELPLPSELHMKYRYEPLVKQVTNLLMRDGELSKAQTNMARILNHLRTAPPPNPNPNKPLLPGFPSPTVLPLNPIAYMTLAIDSIAPLLRIRSQKGAAGGGQSLPIPAPLGLRQRRRQAVMWIIDAATKKRSNSSGKGMFAQKIATELISIVEGKSSIWDKRQALHKLAVSARANLVVRRR